MENMGTVEMRLKKKGETNDNGEINLQETGNLVTLCRKSFKPSIIRKG
jgi:hypothetical protein